MSLVAYYQLLTIIQASELSVVFVCFGTSHELQLARSKLNLFIIYWLSEKRGHCLESSCLFVVT